MKERPEQTSDTVSRRGFLGASAGAAAGLVWGPGAGPAGAAGSAPAKRPNLIYVFADQLRLQSCGYAGDEKARTPNVDRLASRGASFCNALSGHPVCAPYRASLLTGKYSSSTGMVIN